MNAFLRFNQGMLSMPMPWRLWVLLLVAFNGLGPMFFLPRLAALVTLGALAVSMTLMTFLTHWTGFSRLLGLGHVAWVPLVLFLWTRLGSAPADEPFGLWIRGVIALNAISLVIDASDVIRWLAGERGETVEIATARPAR
jgi:hypothetical protein